MEANHRSFHSQQIRGKNLVSDGDHPVGTAHVASQQLDGHGGSVGHLPSGSSSSCESQIFVVRGRGQGLAVSGLMFRSHHGALSLHSGYGSGVVNPSPIRGENFTFPRRLANPCGFSRGRALGEGHRSPVTRGFWNSSEYREIIPDSISSSVLSRGQDRLADFPCFADSFEDRKVVLNGRRISALKKAICEVLEGSARSPGLSDPSCSRWLAAGEITSVGPEVSLGLQGRVGSGGGMGRLLSERPLLVVR